MLAPQVVRKENSFLDDVEVVVTLYDVVPSSMVKMIISEYDEASPDYIFRVFAKHYLNHDYDYEFD